jgi:hypothetical protein
MKSGRGCDRSMSLVTESKPKRRSLAAESESRVLGGFAKMTVTGNGPDFEVKCFVHTGPYFIILSLIYSHQMQGTSQAMEDGVTLI